jgi:D-alanyl-D-alanine carboxypeptidase
VLRESVWRYLGERRPELVVALGGKGAVCSEALSTAGRMSTFTDMELGPRTRLLALVTKSRAIDPERYVPPDLVSFRGGQHQVRPEVATRLEALFDAAAAAGHPDLSVISGFRSYETQKATYEYWVELLGRERADQISARPGHSEHQLGLAVDIAGPSCSGWQCFGDTPEGRWVAAHAHRFGFIIRHPQGGMPVTGYDYEPWHLRYVGPRASWMMTVRDEVYWDRYQPTAVRDGNGF